MLPNYKESILNAIDLAITEHDKIEKIEIIESFYGKSPMSPIDNYDKMIKNNCAVIIGYEYLSDVLLIAKSDSFAETPIFASYASSSKSDSLPKNIFMLQPQYEFLSNKMFNFIIKKFGKLNSTLIIVNYDRDDLLRQYFSYKELLDANKIPFDVFEIVSNDEKLEEKIGSLKEKYGFIFLLTGHSESSRIINTLKNEKIIFIGTENFGSSNNQSVYLGINEKNINAFFIRNVDSVKKTKNLDRFLKSYNKKYQSKPDTMISAYFYDATSIALNSFQKYNKINTNTILSLDYSGATGAKIKNNKFYRSKEYVILSMDKNGIHYEE